MHVYVEVEAGGGDVTVESAQTSGGQSESTAIRAGNGLVVGFDGRPLLIRAGDQPTSVKIRVVD